MTAEDIVSTIKRAVRAGIVRLEEADALDDSDGDLVALAASLRRFPGRHRKRLAKAIEGAVAVSRIEGPAYRFLATDQREDFTVRRSMMDAEVFLALPDPDPAFTPSCESEKKRFVRSLRVRLWRERLEAIPIEPDSFLIVDRDDPDWGYSSVMRWSSRGKTGEMGLCRSRRR